MSKIVVLLFGLVMLLPGTPNNLIAENRGIKEPLTVKKSPDFKLTGNGSSPEWNKSEWNPLIKLDAGGAEDKTRFKILYSTNGIYLLFEGDDQRITTKYDKDFDNLFNGDVFEVFFHPDPTFPLYLEYEVNQLDKELVLIIPNIKGRAQGWTPCHYENGNRVIKKVIINEGRQEPGSLIKSWSAELFFPFRLFSPLSNVPPVSGTVWNANFYRLDYDTGNMIKWAWTPINTSFHEFEKYKPIRFE